MGSSPPPPVLPPPPPPYSSPPPSSTGAALLLPLDRPPDRTAAHSPAVALAVRAAEELDVVDDDLVLGPLAAAVLVFPLVELQPAFDVERVAFLGVLRDQVGQVPLASPGG